MSPGGTEGMGSDQFDRRIIVKKIVRKKGNAINMFFYNCYQNPPGQLLKHFLKIGQLWEPVTWSLSGWVYMKSMIFEVFWEYLGEFLIFLREIFFRSKILSSYCDKRQNFDYECSIYPGNEAQSQHFGHFLTILGIFRAVCFGKSL